jgi:hypothetical protein
MLTNVATAASTYSLSVRVVDHVDNEGMICGHCGEAPVQVTLYLPIGEGRNVDITNEETCTACMIPVLDTTDYLEATHTITVEVARLATLRPF